MSKLIVDMTYTYDKEELTSALRSSFVGDS